MKFVAILALVCACSAYEKEGDVLVLHDDDLDKAIKEFPFILVEFYAPWCGHCKHLTPEYAAAATTLANSDTPIPLAKVDATIETESAQKFEVRGYPTLKFFVNGKDTEYNGGRTAKEIVNWVLKKTGPPAKTLSSVEAVEAFKKTSDVVVVVFAEAGSADVAVAENDARARDDIAYGLVTDSEVASALGQTFPSAVLYKTFDEGVVVFSGEWANGKIDEFAAANSVPLISTFSQESAQKIFGSGINSHFLYFNKVDAASHEGHLASLRQVAAEFKGKTLVVFVPSTEERVLSYFEYSADDLPKAILVSMGEGDMKRYAFNAELTAENVRAHLTAYHDGSLKPTLKSAEAPADNSGPVKVVVGTTFAEIVLDASKDAFVEFYAPWCGHCKSLTPTWEKLGEAFASDDSVVIAKVDATANDVDHPNVSVRGFPTLLWFPANDKANPVSYDGGRDLEELIAFVKSHATAAHSDHSHTHQEL